MVIRRRPRIDPLGHVVPLDGLRAVAVVGVLLYHARFPWIPGGFLGVSVFFTLSGFLITSLLLRQWIDPAGASLRSFWGRRFRRLLPASWATMALVVVAGVLGVWNTDQLRSLRGDVPFALAELVNWHFIAQDRSYGAGFEAPSPLEHFWSLAVEQQFYVVLPLVVVGLLRVAPQRSHRRRIRTLVVVLGVLAVASAVANGVLARVSVDRAYLGTDTRAAELLVGALLAVVTLERMRCRTERMRRVLVAGSILAALATAWLWATATVQTEWLYPWGLLLSATATAAIIAGTLQGGPLAAALSLAPVVWLGRISYGVYLLHWPVFLWLTPARTGLDPWPLFAVRVGVTLIAATVMYHLLEQPIRTGVRLRGRAPAPVAAVSAVALLVGSFWATRDLPPPSSLSLASQQVASAPSTTLPPPPPMRVLVVGDELADQLAAAADRLPGIDATSAAVPGCGLAVGGFVVAADGAVERDVDRCGGSRTIWEAALEETAPEVVLITGTMRDAADRRLSLEFGWSGPADPAVTDLLQGEIADLVDAMGSTGAEVALVSIPPVARTDAPAGLPEPQPDRDPAQQELLAAERRAILEGSPGPGIRENDPARIDHLNAVLADVALRREVRLLDLAAEVREFPSGPFDPLRRDSGVGFTELGARELAQWLGPLLRDRVPAPEAIAPPLLDDTTPLPEPPPAAPRRVVPPGQRVDVLVVGDSVSFTLAAGLIEWSAPRSGIGAATSPRFSCAIARGGSYRFQRDRRAFEDERCDWSVEFPALLASFRPDVVVLSSGIWEVVDRRFPGDDRYRNVGSPDVDRLVLAEFLSAIDVLGAEGANVVVLTQPRIESGRDQGFTGLPESDPARMDRLNELLAEAVSLRPGVATLVDLRGWVAARPAGEMDPGLRPDGVHFSDPAALEVAGWLGPELERIGRGG